MSNDRNPYEAPGSDPSPPRGSGTANDGPPTPVRAPARRGLDWVVRGVGFFSRSPGAWIAAMLTQLGVSYMLAFVPLIGVIAARLLSPVFTGGLMIGCHRVDGGGSFRYQDLFAAFSRPPASRLAGLGGLELVMFMVLAILMGSVWVASGLPVDPTVDPTTLDLDPSKLLWPTLIVLVAVIPMVMLVLFAPALIVFHGMGVTDAMGLSYRACVRNLPALLVWLLTGIAGGLLVSVIVGGVASATGSPPVATLLLLVAAGALWAIFLGSVYAAYADIFLRRGERPPQAATS